jgi:predicted ATP-grasp superfamily ATP-dependent carboligase
VSVLVTDARGNHALATVRSLGGRGVRVAAADSVPWAKAMYSRYCGARATYPCPSEDLAAFQAALLRLLDAVRPRLLMPMTERTILALLERRAEVEARTTLAPLPDEGALGTAFDKSRTIALAESLGIATPRSVCPAGPTDLARVVAGVAFPAVVKPRTSEVHTADGRIAPSGRVQYCVGPDDLAEKYAAVHRHAPRPLVQEFVPGDGYGVSALYRHGRVRALFAYRRLRMVRPTGSGSALRESIALPPGMADAAVRLLDALHWHGVAMVEFKLDPRDGRPRLMEINGRFWNSLPLAVAAGVDFPWLLYTLATEGDVPECFDYRVGVRARWLVGDCRHLVEVMRGRPAGWTDGFPERGRTARDFLRFFGRDLHYDVESLSDPLPAVADVADVVLQPLAAARARRRRRRAEEILHA